MITYEIQTIETSIGNQEFLVKNDNEVISFIPIDPANSDYQAYLATLAANSGAPQA
jgi:hypothetical protein